MRSYRRVFELERRIYRVDRLRLNPSGVPVRGIVYFLALLAGAVLGARLPLLGTLAARLPWWLSDIALPGVVASALAIVRVDGRPFHLAARALVRFRCGSRRYVRLCARRGPLDCAWAPPPLMLVPDGSDARIRSFRYSGPGATRVSVGHELRCVRGPLARVRGHVRVSASDGASRRAGRADEVIVLARGTRLRSG